ncbi:EamA family transporter RarD [Arthrobacter alpinus]|uniref:EamA family transporter RarD n=1 Tax=Arthrobacter alpinus TaxID=656366 RepID=UPI0028F71E95|nr:EamA family transporter RarD [Arthrobacter alpinus]
MDRGTKAVRDEGGMRRTVATFLSVIPLHDGGKGLSWKVTKRSAPEADTASTTALNPIVDRWSWNLLAKPALIGTVPLSESSPGNIRKSQGKAFKPARSEAATGVLYGVGAYGLWGLLPIYFIWLIPANSIEIVANRVVWSVLFCALIITATRGWGKFGAAVKNRRILGTLVVAGFLIVINWLTYVFAVTTGSAIEASLGYFINPLVSVLIGVIVLKEKLRPLQWIAIGVGFVAVVVLTLSYGKLPWIALVLAFSFGTYGFVKNRVGGKVDAITSLSVETAVLTPFAIVAMLVLASAGQATLTRMGPGHFWLLAASGIITAVPLLLFGASASRLSMTGIGLLQFMTPLIQFVVAITLLDEHMGLDRWIGFSIVWVALIILTFDMLRNYRHTTRLRKATL